MNVIDRRMNITALCSAEEPLSLDSVTAGSSLPPLVPVHYTGSSSNSSNSKQTSSNASTSKSPCKKRSRRLSNSERGKLYRSRRKSYVQTLEEQVEQLKNEVDQLSLDGRSRQLQLTSWPIMRQPMDASITSVVNEYFSLFRHGVPVAEQGGIVDIPQDQLLLSTRQIRFLNRLMHPNVVFGNTYGVDELLRQWQKYSLYYSGLKYEVESLQIMAADPNPVLLAPATLYVRFTRRTIEKMFPHVLWNEAFVQRLIGKEFAYPVRNTFYFGDDNKIHRYDAYVDFAAAFVRVLGSVEDSMVMMQSELIHQESMIGNLPKEPPSLTLERAHVFDSTTRVEMMDSEDYSSSGDSSEGQKPAPVGARIGMSLQGIL